MQCIATITASAVIPCCSSTIVNSCFRPALFSVKVWAPLCLGSHPAEETFISTGLCFIRHRRCCFCWHRDLARSARAHTMLRAAGNVQKNNTKMLIRVMCNMGGVQLPYCLSWLAICESICGKSKAGDIPCGRVLRRLYTYFICAVSPLSDKLFVHHKNVWLSASVW